MMKVDVMEFDGPCPFISCLEEGPHEHPVCLRCGAVRYDNYLSCETCCEFKRLASYAQLNDRSAARYLYLLGKVDHEPHPQTVQRWAREGMLEVVRVETGGRGRPPFCVSTESCERFRHPTHGRRGPRGGE